MVPWCWEVHAVDGGDGSPDQTLALGPASGQKGEDGALGPLEQKQAGQPLHTDHPLSRFSSFCSQGWVHSRCSNRCVMWDSMHKRSMSSPRTCGPQFWEDMSSFAFWTKPFPVV